MPPPTPRRVAAAFASLKLSLHLAFLLPYGWFRDELYYLACSRHLDWGYVDHPPLSVAILRVWRALFGESLASVRLAPALAGAATVYLCGLLTVELGGGALAVALACLSLLLAPIPLFFGHIYSMNAFDALFWALGVLLALRAVKSGRWVALGIVLGLGLLNKISVLWLGAALLVGLLGTPHRRHLRTMGPYLAGVIALAIFVPHLVWQTTHDFATLEFMRNAMEHKYVRQSPIAFLIEITMGMNPATVLVWLPGLVYGLWRPGTTRLVALLFASVLLLLVAARAKPEYLSVAMPAVFALGGCFWERRRVVAWILLAVVAVVGCVSAPFTLPVLPVESFLRYQEALGQKPSSNEKKDIGDLPQQYADMFGWEALAARVDEAAATLAPDERKGAVIWVTSNYGVAGAIEKLGTSGLHVACGHNSFWWWGPGQGDGRAVIVVGGKKETLAKYFRELTQTGTFECAHCMPYENHKPIYVGRGLVTPLAQLWPDERTYE